MCGSTHPRSQGFNGWLSAVRSVEIGSAMGNHRPSELPHAIFVKTCGNFWLLSARRYFTGRHGHNRLSAHWRMTHRQNRSEYPSCIFDQKNAVAFGCGASFLTGATPMRLIKSCRLSGRIKTPHFNSSQMQRRAKAIKSSAPNNGGILEVSSQSTPEFRNLSITAALCRSSCSSELVEQSFTT